MKNCDWEKNQNNGKFIISTFFVVVVARNYIYAPQFMVSPLGLANLS